MKKVSVIVPVYNVDKYLDKCLDSLVNQTLKDIEIIIVNDGSKDDSEKIIKKYQKKYPEIIKAYKKSNGGLSDARNYGLKYASGNYIAFVDGDDYVDINMFSKMYNYAKENKLDIVVCDTMMQEENNTYALKSNLGYSFDMVKNYIISYPMACIRLVKSSLMKKHKFEKGILYEDLNLMPILALDTEKIGFLEEPLYYYVIRSGSIMQQKEFSLKLLDIFKVLENIKKNLYPKYKDEVEYLYITHLLRSTTLRFLDYKNIDKYLIKINEVIKEEFPNWKNNIYLKKSSFKLKLICNLAYKRCYKILTIIKKLSNK